MVIEIAAGTAALAAVVLVAFLVPLLIRLCKSAEEFERLLRQLNEELPVVLWEAKQTAQNLNQVTTDVARGTTFVAALVTGARATVLRTLQKWRTGLRTGLQVLRHGRDPHQQRALPPGGE